MKTFLTQKGRFRGPQIEALDFAHAEQQAFEMDVTVIGEHVLTLSRKGFTESDADRLCKALSESEVEGGE